MAFDLGSAFIKVKANLAPLKAGMLKVKSLLTNGISLAFKAAKIAAKIGVVGIAAAIGAGIGLVKLGSDLEEMQSKFDAVFKEEKGAAEAFAASLAKGVGRSRVEVKGFMSELQDLFVPMGFARDQARELASQVTALGIDLASFNNMTDDEAILALNAGLTGSHEVLKKFGVFINDNVLSLKLQELGLAKNAQVATEPAKAMARLQIILASTSDAQGDAARTSGGLANQWKRLKGNLFDLASQIGGALIPAAQQVIQVFSGMAGFFDSNKDSIAGFAASLSEGLATAIEFVKGIVDRLVTAWSASWAVMGETVTAIWNFIVTVIGGAISTIIEFFVSYIEWGEQLKRSIFEFAGLSGGAFTTFGNSVIKIFSKMKEVAITVFSTIKGWIESVVFAFLNWDLVVQKVALNIAKGFINLGGRVINFVENAVILFKCMGQNWSDIIFTTIDLILTALINLGKNIRKLFTAVWDAISSGSLDPIKNISFEPILKGAVNTIKKMSKFNPFIGTTLFDKQLKGIDKKWDERSKKWKEIMKKNAPDIGDAAGDGAQDALDKKEFKLPKFDPKKFKIEGTVKGKGKKDKSDAGSFKGLAAVWKSVQSKLLKGGENLDKKKVELATKTLAENKKQTKLLAKKPKAATFS